MSYLPPTGNTKKSDTDAEYIELVAVKNNLSPINDWSNRAKFYFPPFFGRELQESADPRRRRRFLLERRVRPRDGAKP